jgi:hypothetical protein
MSWEYLGKVFWAKSGFPNEADGMKLLYRASQRLLSTGISFSRGQTTS